jgi:7 transmembrane receptor (rhodopsin family)
METMIMNINLLFPNLNFIKKVLGWHGCMGVPFLQTVSVLTGSMSLVLIALDRFLAVRNKSNEKLLQSKMFCLAVIICVWLLGCGIGMPVLFAYEFIDALVIPDGGDEKSAYHGSVCITDPVSKLEGENQYFF